MRHAIVSSEYHEKDSSRVREFCVGVGYAQRRQPGVSAPRPRPALRRSVSSIVHSGSVTPDPPISLGMSLNFGLPSRMGSTLS